jgi:hypothetical protein
MLNKKDIDTLIIAMKVVFPTTKEVSELIEEKLEEKIKLLPTKEEFFSRMDGLSGEVKDMREAQELHAGDHMEINDRQEKIEKRLKISSQ